MEAHGRTSCSTLPCGSPETTSLHSDHHGICTSFQKELGAVHGSAGREPCMTHAVLSKCPHGAVGATGHPHEAGGDLEHGVKCERVLDDNACRGERTVAENPLWTTYVIVFLGLASVWRGIWWLAKCVFFVLLHALTKTREKWSRLSRRQRIFSCMSVLVCFNQAFVPAGSRASYPRWSESLERSRPKKKRTRRYRAC